MKKKGKEDGRTDLLSVRQDDLSGRKRRANIHQDETPDRNMDPQGMFQEGSK